MNSEPATEKNGTPASPATARASNVLPVPAGPTKSAPLGVRAPIARYFSGCFKKSTTSCSSCLASSTPATSAKVTLDISRVNCLARDWPKEKTLDAPSLACLKIKKKKRIIIASGKKVVKIVTHACENVLSRTEMETLEISTLFAPSVSKKD